MMGEWTFFSNHGHVLVCLARDREARLRDVAIQVGITERAVQKIVKDMQDAGYLEISKHGRRNRYRINNRKSLRHPLQSGCTVGQLVQLLNKQTSAKPEKKEEPTRPQAEEPVQAVSETPAEAVSETPAEAVVEQVAEPAAPTIETPRPAIVEPEVSEPKVSEPQESESQESEPEIAESKKAEPEKSTSKPSKKDLEQGQLF